MHQSSKIIVLGGRSAGKTGLYFVQNYFNYLNK